jgi:hemerythrin
MNKKVFAPLGWTKDMSVGVDVIDEDHHKLLSLLNEMNYIIDADAVSAKGAIESVLSELIEYTEYHFDREEILMQACEYPELEKHKYAHEALRAEAKSHMDGYRRNPLSFTPKILSIFLQSWLVNHIMGMDKDYESWMQGKDDIIEKANADFERERH